jgi:hypothetical protein
LQDALPEANTLQTVTPISSRDRNPTRWWQWALAGAVGSALLLFVYLDEPREKSTLAVQAHWSPPN